MSNIVKLGENFFLSMFWIVVALIAAFAILGWISNKFSGNFIGNSAYWTEQHLQPQGM